jgi:hypothetical protein
MCWQWWAHDLSGVRPWRWWRKRVYALYLGQLALKTGRGWSTSHGEVMCTQHQTARQRLRCCLATTAMVTPPSVWASERRVRAREWREWSEGSIGSSLWTCAHDVEKRVGMDATWCQVPEDGWPWCDFKFLNFQKWLKRSFSSGSSLTARFEQTETS